MLQNRFGYRIALSTVCDILGVVLKKIWETVGRRFVKVPSTKEQWEKVSDDFFRLWNFPNCLGAIDGKHCQIICPQKSGSTFFNYKGTFSVVLMAACDASYHFTYVDVGDFGRQGDSTIFNRSTFGKALDDGKFSFSRTVTLPGTKQKVCPCFVGDEAFPLQDFLQRPFPGALLPQRERIYNYRLSRARRVIENTFGILVARWRFLRSPVELQPTKAVDCILASIALHNWLKTVDTTIGPYGTRYCPPKYADYVDRHGIVHLGV